MFICDVDTFSFYGVSTMFDVVLCSIGKELCLQENYPNGHSDQFMCYLIVNHPYALCAHRFPFWFNADHDQVEHCCYLKMLH